MVAVTAKSGVEAARPNLAVGGERPSLSANDKIQWLEVLELVVRQTEHASLAIFHCPSRRHVSVEMIYDPLRLNQ